MLFDGGGQIAKYAVGLEGVVVSFPVVKDGEREALLFTGVRCGFRHGKVSRAERRTGNL